MCHVVCVVLIFTAFFLGDIDLLIFAIVGSVVLEVIIYFLNRSEGGSSMPDGMPPL